MSSDISTYDTVQPSLSRRDLLKTGVAAGAATVGVAASSGSASATTTPSLVATPIISPGYLAVAAVGSAIGGVLGSSPDTSDRLTLHKQATQEKEAWDGHTIQMENRLVDMPSIASIEARHGIAQTYESGGNEAAGVTNALERIRQYYSNAPEHNIIELSNKALLSLRAIQPSGDKTDPVFVVAGAWQATESESAGQLVFYPNGNESGDLDGEDPGLTNSTVTRHDGQTHEVGVGVQNADDNPLESPMTPIVEVYDGSYYDSGSSKIDEFVPLSDDILDSYDSSTGEFVFSLDDGTEITTPLRFTIPTIEDSDGNQLRESKTVYDHGELAEILTEISDQSDTVVANYDENFVGELFALMDDGTIDPSDIRGSEGIARFLSGTDDASASRFQMALMQQLGMSRSDLSTVASMTIEYTGFTEASYSEDSSGNRIRSLSGEVTDRVMEGQLFANGVEILAVGETYQANPLTYVADTSNGAVKAVDTGGAVKWSASQASVHGVSYDPDNGLVLAGGDGSTDSVVYDGETGSEQYTVTQPSASNQQAEQLDYHSGQFLIGIRDPNVTAVDSASGSTNWTYTGDDPNGSLTCVAAGDSGVFVSAEEGNNPNGDLRTRLLDTDGTRLWASSTLGYGSAAVFGGQIFAERNGDLHEVSTDDGSEVRSKADLSGDVVAVDQGGSNLVVATTTTLFVLDTTDFSTVHSISLDKTAASIDARAGFAYVGFSDDSTAVVDYSAGIASTPQINATGSAGVAISSAPGAESIVVNASMFDAPNGEEVSLHRGEFTVKSISDADGNALETAEYTDPNYDTYDSQEYAKYVEEYTTYKETIYQDDSGFSWPAIPWGDGGNWLPDPPLIAIAALVLGYLYFGRDDN